MKWTKFESVIFLKHKGSVTKYVEVSLDFRWLNKTFDKIIENQKPLPSELYTLNFHNIFNL